jgi:hypothetical protein
VQWEGGAETPLYPIAARVKMSGSWDLDKQTGIKNAKTQINQKIQKKQNFFLTFPKMCI